MKDTILKFDKVQISYNNVPAISEVSVTVERGEILGIVGESGSGKSTLIRSAMGLLGTGGRVTDGDIRYFDKQNGYLVKEYSIAGMPEKELRKLRGARIAMIFQNAGSSFCPIRRIDDQLWEAASSHDRMQKKEAFFNEADGLLRAIGLSDGKKLLRRYPFELSGGMQQRIGIAGALLLKPDLLLADEPTGAIDVVTQREVIELLQQTRKNYGTSIVLVTHHLGVAAALCDHIMVMEKGRSVEYGTKTQVLNAPTHPYTKKLIDAIPRMP